MTDGDLKKKCFFISPIGPEGSEQRVLSDKVLKHIVRKGLGDAFVVERGDEPENPGSITPQLIAGIISADLIVADLTGGNANVYYEIAIAHGYRRPTVHIQRKGDKVEFDVKDMRIVPYDLDPDDIEVAQKTLLKFAEFAIAKPDEVETPLTSAQDFAAVRESVDPVAESNVLVIDAIESLSRDVRRVLRSRSSSARDSESRANTKSLRTFVERAAASTQVDSDWFESMITPSTSSAFDSWLAVQFKIATGVDDAAEAHQTIWSESMFEQMAAGDETVD